jgi:superoxide dismutase, Fe-Mn family
MSESSMDRREVLIGSAALIAATGFASEAEATPPKQVAATEGPVLQGTHKVEPLSFDPAKLNGLSERMMRSHHENNYAGAVKNLNRAEQELAAVTKDTPPFVVAALRERELNFRGSKLMHEQYFGNLGGDGKRAGAIEQALSRSYGSSARWEEQFRFTGLGLGGGSGWVVLGYELDSGSLRTIGLGNHTQSLGLFAPLLVMDMYEHAYQMDFGAAAATYIDAFMTNVKWETVEKRLLAARRARAASTG